MKDLGRNIKGDHNRLKGVGDSNSEQPLQGNNQVGINREETQIQPPPPGGSNVMSEVKDGNKRGANQQANDRVEPEADNLNAAMPKSHQQSLEFHKSQPSNNVAADDHTRPLGIKDTTATDENVVSDGVKLGDKGEVIKPGHGAEEMVGGVDVGEGEQVSRKKKEVGAIKKKSDTASEVIPVVGADSVAPIPKRNDEDAISRELDAGAQQLALPPGVVARPKKRVTVNDNRGQQGGGVTERDGGGGGGVKAVPTEMVAVNEVGRGGGQGGGGEQGGRGGEGEGGVKVDAVAVKERIGDGGGVKAVPNDAVNEVGMGGGGGKEDEMQMNAAEMAQAIESGEMVNCIIIT